MSRVLYSAVLVLALVATAARAEDVYVWTDASGETHYTNDVASIPEKARRSARKLENEPPTVVPRNPDPKPPGNEPPKGQPTADQPPPPEPIEETIHAPREDEKVTEDQWRTMFRKANDKVHRAERKAQRTRESLSRLPGQDVTTTYDQSGNLVMDSRYVTLKTQLQEDDYQLNVAQEELHDLERAAAREAIPLEWRR
jgi:type IV secretory pathway VirB10-like protein